MLSGLENPIHIILILAVILIVVGPSQLPKLARTSGRRLRETKDAAASFKDEFERGVDDATPKRTTKPELTVADVPSESEPAPRAATHDAPE